MRFMMMIIPKGYETAAPDKTPDFESIQRMTEYNMSLGKAGVLLALDGLLPPSTASRVSFSGGKPTVTDGPFAEAKEAIGGFWIIQADSREEAVEWAKRAPVLDDEVIEVRRMFELTDFPEEVQRAVVELHSKNGADGNG